MATTLTGDQAGVRRTAASVLLVALTAFGLLFGSALVSVATAGPADAATRWASPADKRPASWICRTFNICKTEKICWKGNWRIAYTSTKGLPTNCMTYRY